MLYINKPKYEQLHSKVYLSLIFLCVIVHFAEFGFRERGKKNMSQGYFLYSTTLYFENFNAILPNDGRDRFFDVDEVEIYKIVFY